MASMSIIGNQHRKMGDLGVARILDPQLAVLDHRDVGGCPADVDGDHVSGLAGFTGPTAANNAARRPRKQQADRSPRGILDRRDTAIRLHDPHLGGDAVFAEPPFKLLQIERGGRTDISIHRR